MNAHPLPTAEQLMIHATRVLDGAAGQDVDHVLAEVRIDGLPVFSLASYNHGGGRPISREYALLFCDEPTARDIYKRWSSVGFASVFGVAMNGFGRSATPKRARKPRTTARVA